jgi:Acetyltransferase (GNAT) domain
LNKLLQRDEVTVPERSPGANFATGTIFHEQWWLKAVTNGEYQEVTFKNGQEIVGRLPFVIRKRLGLTTLRMPPFTHILGPTIAAGDGKPQTKLAKYLSISKELVDQLPPFAYFKQALADPYGGLAFQDRGFQVTTQYTFEIDCRGDLKSIWDAMHFKSRQHIRRAEEKFSVSTVSDPEEFIRFYSSNIVGDVYSTLNAFQTFPATYDACRARGCGEIISADWPNGKRAAMVFLVWGNGVMYYLMSTRSKDAGDNGSVNLLIWSAVKRAHERKLLFDLDGVSTSGIARFLLGFGGKLKNRAIVQRSSPLYSSLVFSKSVIFRSKSDKSSSFT